MAATVNTLDTHIHEWNYDKRKSAVNALLWRS